MDQEPDSGENAETAVQPPPVRGWIVLFVVVTAVSLVRATEGFFVFMSSVESHALPSPDVAPAERLYDIVAGVSGGVGAIPLLQELPRHAVSSIWDDPLGALRRTRCSTVAREEAEGGAEMREE